METRVSRELALKIEGIRKQYRMGVIGGKTLQEDMQSWWAKKRGKDDPNQRVDFDSRLAGRKFMALDGIDLTIYKGEAVGIIGNNGAGKTTLLKLISQITAPTEGTIDIYGRVASMLEIGTGFHREMTGRENIYMNGAILGMTKAEIDSRMEEIIDFSEVREFIDTPVKRYSSGMFVKLAFAVAAHLNSEIMIMDEVLAVGDMAFQEKCLTKMRSAAKEGGRTVLYVSHNMNTIRQLCDRCIVINEGKVIFDGDTEKAIAVYMNHAVGEDEVNIDLAAKKHAGERALDGAVLRPALEMEFLTLRDKVTAVYESGEELRMTLRVKVNEPVDGVKFRLTLRNNVDVAIGTAWSEVMDFGGALDGRLREINMTMPLDNLAAGIMYGSIGLYRMDELGREIKIDHITRAFVLEIKGKPTWSVHAHGYTKLPEIRVESDQA